MPNFVKKYFRPKTLDQNSGNTWFYDALKAGQTMAECQTEGFFNGISSEHTIRDGDILIINATDGTKLYSIRNNIVTSLSTEVQYATDTIAGIVILQINPEEIQSTTKVTTPKYVTDRLANYQKLVNTPVLNNVVKMDGLGQSVDAGFSFKNNNPYLAPSPIQVADTQSTKDYIDLAVSNSLPKSSVALLFDSNQALSGLPSQGGYTCIDGDRVLCNGQTDQSKNLIYVVHVGDWDIATDATTVDKIKSGYATITRGTYSNQYWQVFSVTPLSGNVAPTSVNWTNVGSSSGGGSVASVSVVNANGFSGSVLNPTTTPSITLSTSASGVLKGNAGALVPATAGTDYLAPTLTSANLLVGNTSNVATGVPLSGDATISNTGVLTIGDNAVTNSKLNIAGANTYKGNSTGATANVSDIATNTAFNQDFETSPNAIKMDGVASVGISSNIARADHTHPSDTAKQSRISVIGVIKGIGAGGLLPANASDIVSTLGATATPTSSTAVLWDTNKNLHANNLINNVTTTATTAETTTLTVASAGIQRFTGTTTQTIVLPESTTLSIGTQYYFQNESAGALTIKTNGGATLSTIPANSDNSVTLINNSSPVGIWHVGVVSSSGGSGTVSSVSVVSANGLSGTVANPTTTPEITLSTSITGMLKGDGTSISAGTSGIDYSAGTHSLNTGILKSTTGTGALTIATASDIVNALGATSTPTADTVVLWDSNRVLRAMRLSNGVSIASNAVISLGVDSVGIIALIGIQTSATVILPNPAAPSNANMQFVILNDRNCPLIINKYDGSNLLTVPVGYDVTVCLIDKLVDKWIATTHLGRNNSVVTSASVVSANGFSGTVANPTTTPAITLSTSAEGLLKGSSGSLVPAIAGTDYSLGTSALGTGILKSTTSTGDLSIATASDFPILNQNTTGLSANVTGVVAIANGGTGQTTQQGAINALTGTQSAGKYLRSDGTNSTLSTIQVSDVPTLNQNTTGSAGSISSTNVITNNNLAQMSGNTLKGNNTGGFANAIDLNGTQVTAMLNNVVGDSGSGGTKGLVPAPAVNDAAAGKFLKADGTWAVPAGGNTVNRFYRSIRFSPGTTGGIQTITPSGLTNLWGNVAPLTTRITINNSVLQVGGFTNTTNNISIPVPGNYRVTITFSYTTGSSARELWCQLVNTPSSGTSVVLTVAVSYQAIAAMSEMLSMDYIGAFSINDVIDFRVDTTTGTSSAGSVNITSYSVCIQQIV